MASLFAFVPGLVLHGSGHFALGARDTAYRLLAMQGIGLGAMALAIVPIVTTGASRYPTTFSAPLAIGGLSVASTAWLADLFGTMVPPELRGLPERSVPNVEAEVGYRYAAHPSVRFGSIMVQRLALRWEGLLVEPAAWYAIDGRNARFRAAMSYRYFGPRAFPAPLARSGSLLELGAAATEHRFPAERFRITTGEVTARGRLDLHDLDDTLSGMFSELELGLGLERYDYEVARAPAGGRGFLPDTTDAGDSSATVPGDYAWLLLGRFGVGFYLGGEQAPVGELLLYYDHRHDDFAGGLHQAFVGIAGHAGAAASLYLTEQVGLRAELEAGGGIMGGLSLLIRRGGSQ